MRRKTQVVEAPAEEAQIWLRYSMEQGFEVSAAVLDAGFIDRGRGLAIVSDEFQRTPFEFSHGGVIGTAASRECLGRMLVDGEFGPVGSLLVEDDVRRKGDPWISKIAPPSAFIGERVLHWADSEMGIDKVVEAIHRGGFGYPLNVFLMTKSSAELGLVDREDAPEELPQEVVSSLLVVVVSAFDNESFLIWTPDRS
jgi:hypothetical protein